MKLACAARYFDAIAPRYDHAYALPAAESRLRMERVLAALPRGPLRILDLGVGSGALLCALMSSWTLQRKKTSGNV